MPKEVLYLKLEQNAELSGESVHISDLGKLYCKTQSVQNRCRTLPVFRFEEKDKGRRVVSALFVISLLQQDNPNLEVESIRRAGNGGGAGKSQSLSGLLAGVQNRLCLLHLLFWRSVYDHGVS